MTFTLKNIHTKGEIRNLLLSNAGTLKSVEDTLLLLSADKEKVVHTVHFQASKDPTFCFEISRYKMKPYTCFKTTSTCHEKTFKISLISLFHM